MYNKAFLVGNLTRDPEMRFTGSGLAVTRFTIAINRISRSDKNEADFIRIVTWRKLAEFCGEYLAKGRSVAITGRLQIDSYEKDGRKKYSAEVIAEDVQFLSKKNDFNTNKKNSSSIEEENNDIPF